jgi:NifU-like protein involved in Fe-S cluster formation
MMSEMVTEKGGMTLEQAANLKAMDINTRLGGLPTIKIHCSILGDQALKAAVKDYLEKLK